MLGHSSNYANYSGFARVTDTDPQIAVVGMTEDDLTKRDKRYSSIILPLSVTTASKTQDFKMGFIKMISSKDGKILGATIMAPNAAEIIQEVAVMVRNNFTMEQIVNTPHVAAAWSDMIRLAAKQLL